MKTKKKTTCIETKLMEYALNKGVDLWVFKEAMLNTCVKYEDYLRLWREVSRTKLTEDEFEELRYLLKVYTKE